MKNAIHVGCLIANAVGGRIGKHFQSEVEFFLDHNGPEWTSRRLKAIWTAALHLRNGDKEKAIQIYQDNSISYHSDGFPKGNIGKAVKEFTKCNKPSSLKRWSSLLRYYTGITLGRPSVRQIADAIRNISGPFTGNPQSNFPERLKRFSVRFSEGKQGHFQKLWFYLDNIKGSTRYYSPYKLPKACKNLYYGSCVHSLLSTSYLPKSLEYFVPDWETRQFRLYHQGENDRAIGKIAILQEGGGKARVVAMPNAWLQLGFFPFHKSLSNLTEDLFPESCVRDQVKGVRYCLAQLRAGGECYSIDLTAASDRIPLDISLSLIEHLGYRQYIEGFREVVKKNWTFPYDPENRFDIQYSVGQPMGLYGSFPLLHFTNLMIGKYCEAITLNDSIFKSDDATIRALRDPNRDLNFVVVGDDIVFFNSAMANAYKEIMKDLGVQISATKSFDKDVVQFAGFTILKHGKGDYYAFRPYKHPTQGYVRNPIEFLNALGSSVTHLNDQKWERMYFEYTQTVGQRDMDLTPLSLEGKDDSQSPQLVTVDERWILSVRERLLHSYSGSTIGALGEDAHPGTIPWEESSKSEEPLVLEERFDQVIGYSPQDFEFHKERESEMSYRVPGRSFFKDPLISERRNSLKNIIPSEDTARQQEIGRSVTEREAVLATTRPSDRVTPSQDKKVDTTPKPARKRNQSPER